MLTKNTKFYKITTKINMVNTDIYYKELSALELNIIFNIKNILARYEMACKFSVTNIDHDLIPYQIKAQIGEDIIKKSQDIIVDDQLLELTIMETRQKIKDGSEIAYSWISHIIKVFPGTSIVDLLNMNYKDLLELVILVEEITGSQIFGKKKKKGSSLINPSALPDGGASIRDQLKSFQ